MDRRDILNLKYKIPQRRHFWLFWEIYYTVCTDTILKMIFKVCFEKNHWFFSQLNKILCSWYHKYTRQLLYIFSQCIPKIIVSLITNYLCVSRFCPPSPDPFSKTYSLAHYSQNAVLIIGYYRKNRGPWDKH